MKRTTESFAHQATGNSWQPLPPADLASIMAARDQIHRAIQLPAQIARAVNPEQPGDAHAALEWLPGLNVMSSQALRNEKYFRIGIKPSTLELLFLTRELKTIHLLPLAGLTFNNALDILSNEFNISKLKHQVPYELPERVVSRASAFELPAAASFAWLEQLYGNAYHQLQIFVNREAEASPIYLWPHHFDLATLVSFKAINEGKSIGIGLSPGDEGINEPYFYVNLWPYPDASGTQLPEICGGQWSTEGWTGTYLTATEILDSADQGSTVSVFLESSYQACAGLLGI